MKRRPVGEAAKCHSCGKFAEVIWVLLVGSVVAKFCLFCQDQFLLLGQYHLVLKYPFYSYV